MTRAERELAAAAILLRDGKLIEAAAIYRSILAHDAKQPEALHQAAVLARQSGNLPQALAHLELAIAVAPIDLRNYFLCGLMLEDLGRPDDAIACLLQAIRVAPSYAAAYNNIGIILSGQKRTIEAIAYFRKAIEHQPDYVRAHFNLAASLLELGRFQEAEIQFSTVLGLDPNYLKATNLLGFVQQQLSKFDEAAATFHAAIKINLGNKSTEFNSLGNVYWEQGRIEQTLAAYQQAIAFAPHSLKASLGALLSLPAVYRGIEDLLETRKRFADGLQVLHGKIQDFSVNNPSQAILAELKWSNFYLAYQGLDDKAMQIAYADFVAQLLMSAAPQYMRPLEKKSTEGRRIRIGFLSRYLANCTIGMYFKSWILQLNTDHFDIYIYQLRPDGDEVTQEIRDACGHFRAWNNNTVSISTIADTVMADNLDILVYPELGMDSATFLLAAMRLAPLQCAAWGHPVTTGHNNIDHFFSSAAMEPDQAATHYAEKLVLLDGLGTCYKTPLLPSPAHRADYALPEGKTLYLCPQSLFKIHPECDWLIAQILKQDVNGVVVLFGGRHTNITNLFFKRFSAALSALGIDPRGRGVILPRTSHDDYLRINMLCDVMLDTLHWSGGNTTLDALACNLPVVTLPGKFMRGRQSYGMLQLLGLDELIASDEKDYVAKAVRLGTDRDWRQKITKKIAENKSIIFDDERPIRQLEQFYLANSASVGSTTYVEK